MLNHSFFKRTDEEYEEIYFKLINNSEKSPQETVLLKEDYETLDDELMCYMYLHRTHNKLDSYPESAAELLKDSLRKLDINELIEEMGRTIHDRDVSSDDIIDQYIKRVEEGKSTKTYLFTLTKKLLLKFIDEIEPRNTKNKSLDNHTIFLEEDFVGQIDQKAAYKNTEDLINRNIEEEPFSSPRRFYKSTMADFLLKAKTGKAENIFDAVNGACRGARVSLLFGEDRYNIIKELEVVDMAKVAEIWDIASKNDDIIEQAKLIINSPLDQLAVVAAIFIYTPNVAIENGGTLALFLPECDDTKDFLIDLGKELKSSNPEAYDPLNIYAHFYIGCHRYLESEHLLPNVRYAHIASVIYYFLNKFENNAETGNLSRFHLEAFLDLLGVDYKSKKFLEDDKLLGNMGDLEDVISKGRESCEQDDSTENILMNAAYAAACIKKNY